LLFGTLRTYFFLFVVSVDDVVVSVADVNVDVSVVDDDVVVGSIDVSFELTFVDAAEVDSNH
jgi:hypothetical protein